MLLAPGEASRLLAAVAEAHRLAVSLLNGAGLRLMECLTLRLKDVDLARRRIHVRDGKGGKGRFTMPPEALRAAIIAQMDGARRQHLRDRQRGGGYVELPGRSIERVRGQRGIGGGCGSFPRPGSTSIMRLARCALHHPPNAPRGIASGSDSSCAGTTTSSSRVRHDDSAGGGGRGTACRLVETCYAYTRHPLPPNSRPGLLALRTRVAWRYFGHGDGSTPPPADFGGVEVPAIHGYAVESWLLRNRLVGVRPSHQL